MLLLTLTVLAQAEPASKESLEKAVRDLHSAMASGPAEARIQALKRILPTRENLDLLLPSHAAKLWPRWEPVFAEMEKNVDKVAQEMLGKGGLQAVELKDLNESERGRRALDLLPKGTLAFDYVNRYEKGSSGGGSYVHVRGRWILFRGLSSLPELLQKLQ